MTNTKINETPRCWSCNKEVPRSEAVRENQTGASGTRYCPHCGVRMLSGASGWVKPYGC